MSFIDTKYISLVSPQLTNFSQKKKGLYNFRCPYCGDSQKRKNKSRGYLFQYKDSHVYKCHNCGVSKSFAKFLQDISVGLYDQYIMERYKEGTTGKGRRVPNPKFEFKTPVFKEEVKETTVLDSLEKISDLNINHPAKTYLLQRQIPETHFSGIYYTEDFNAWENNGNNFKEARIVLPLLSQSGKLYGYQGRSLDKDSKLRYITTILDKRYPKIYGLERIKFESTIYVTEGPIDSLFLSNAIAMCGADITLDKDIYQDRVFIYDNEPRNKQIVQRYEATINQGEKIVIWQSNVKEKDINDMVLGGRDVQHMVECSTYQGLEAKLKFNEWKKI